MPKIFPPVYMLLAALLMWLLANYFPIFGFDGAWLKTLAVLFFVLGLAIDAWSLLLFFRAKTTFHPLKLKNTSALVTSGMYQFTRNPMYLGMALLLTGWFFYLGAVSPIVVIPVFVHWITKVQIMPEEKILTEKFGEKYLAYTQKVRRWL